MREQTGALAPPSFDANKMRQVQKGGVMGTVFSGKSSRTYKMPEVNHELSLEMNKKMQSVLEDTLLKNIQLKVSACVGWKEENFHQSPPWVSFCYLCNFAFLLVGKHRHIGKRDSENISSVTDLREAEALM
jgi:hypothetical protein